MHLSFVLLSIVQFPSTARAVLTSLLLTLSSTLQSMRGMIVAMMALLLFLTFGAQLETGLQGISRSFLFHFQLYHLGQWLHPLPQCFSRSHLSSLLEHCKHLFLKLVLLFWCFQFSVLKYWVLTLTLGELNLKYYRLYLCGCSFCLVSQGLSFGVFLLCSLLKLKT